MNTKIHQPSEHLDLQFEGREKVLLPFFFFIKKWQGYGLFNFLNWKVKKSLLLD